jgi:hypothetical protein
VPFTIQASGAEQKYRSMSSALLKLAFMARRIVATINTLGVCV